MKDRLVFVKTLDPTEICCAGCAFANTRKCNVENCESDYVYKLVEEPEEIQTEYEWKKERAELLRDIGSVSDQPEFNVLQNWLKENKPEKWETCTRENTKAGNIVRTIKQHNVRTIEHIFTKKSDCDEDLDCVASYPCLLSKYEINIAQGEI